MVEGTGMMAWRFGTAELMLRTPEVRDHGSCLVHGQVPGCTTITATTTTTTSSTGRRPTTQTTLRILISTRHGWKRGQGMVEMMDGRGSDRPIPWTSTRETRRGHGWEAGSGGGECRGVSDHPRRIHRRLRWVDDVC